MRTMKEVLQARINEVVRHTLCAYAHHALNTGSSHVAPRPGFCEALQPVDFGDLCC